MRHDKGYARNTWVGVMLALLLAPVGLAYTSGLLAVAASMLILIFLGPLASNNTGVVRAFIALVCGLSAWSWLRWRPDLSRFPLLARVDRPHVNVSLVLGLLLFFILVGYTRLIRTYVGLNGYSMAPTILDGERVRVDILPTVRGTIQRGTIVRYSGSQPKGQFMSRVVALEGDSVEMKKGLVYVNSVAADDPERIALLRKVGCLNTDLTINNVARLASGNASEQKSVRVPPGHIFVLADNRSTDLMDSRVLGTLPLSRVTGVVRVPVQARTNFSEVNCLPLTD